VNKSYIPDRKVVAGGFAGILTWALMLVAGRYGVVVDPAMQPVLASFAGTLIGYLVPPSQRDIIKRLDDQIVAIAAADPTVPVDPTTKPRR
jgi:hypothetical protein